MEANDERWNLFVEAYGRLQTKCDELLEFATSLIVDDETYDRLEEIKNGKD